MYKKKLQELCHKKKWRLPKYWATREGPDHEPRYEGSVLVNDLTFTSQGSFSSTKEAQNQAAMLAFLSSTSTPPGSSTPKEQIEAAKPQDISIPAQSAVIIDDMDPVSKSQLNSYAQKNKVKSPIYYTSKSGGPSHASRFKATVQFGGQSFEGPVFFNTIKEAEQAAAAKVALVSSSLDNSDKCDCGPFKTLLLELTQREGFSKPVYETVLYEPFHGPTFFTTVKVEGMEFHGKASRSKKDAEEDASWIAYIALKECGVNMLAAFSSYNRENKAAQSIPSSDILKSKHNLKHEGLELNGKRKYSKKT